MILWKISKLVGAAVLLQHIQRTTKRKKDTFVLIHVTLVRTAVKKIIQTKINPQQTTEDMK